MRWEIRVLLAATLCLAMAVIAGCGGSSSSNVFQNVFDRATWSPNGGRLAFESIGGNGLFYIYSIDSNGGNLTLLTPSLNDTDDLTHEGGKMPAWSPVAANNEMVMVARRGTGGEALYKINPTNPSLSTTLLTNDTVVGNDSEPSWSNDGNTIIYVSNKGTTHYTIWTVGRDGSNPHEIFDPATALSGICAAKRTTSARAVTPSLDAQWPVFSPDGSRIAFQLGIGGIGVDTLIIVMNADGSDPVALGANNGFRDEAPWFSPDGSLLAFHSDRFGDFDILTMNSTDGSNPTRLTGDSRSDGFPVWSDTVDRIAFTRDRELWSMAADGTDQKQLTRRF